MIKSIKRVVGSLISLIVVTVIFWWLEMKLLESGYIDQKIIDVDGNKFMVPTFVIPDSDPRKISNVGSKLVCETLQEVLGQKAETNKYFKDVKSVVSKKGTYVDCFEPKTNILLDYLSQDYYKYDGPNYINTDVYDFYNRMAINESKKEKLLDKEFNYLQVPYTVDICEKVNDEFVCDKKTPLGTRKERIRNYLKENLSSMF